MHITRRPTRQIQVGKVKIGGDAPVSVQSMCSTDTRDVATTVEQIRQLEAAGCELIRVAVPDEEAAAALPSIKAAMTVPLDRRHPFRSSVGLEGRGNRRLRPHQPGQHRRLVEGGRGHQGRKRARNPAAGRESTAVRWSGLCSTNMAGRHPKRFPNPRSMLCMLWKTSALRT